MTNTYILQKRKPTYNQDFFETIDTEEKAYWLGFIAADGSISNNKRYRIRLKLSNKDINHLKKFGNSINFENLIRVTKLSKYNTQACIISLCSKKMFNDLLDKGIMPRKSLILKPPKNIPRDLLRHWIRGYFDGDGCIHFQNERLTFNIVGTIEVLKFILLNSSLDLKISIAGNSKAFLLRGSGTKANLFLHYIYDNSLIYMDRKFNLFIQGPLPL
jgi:intein-encoded DNA endonuclease-like protein